MEQWLTILGAAVTVFAVIGVGSALRRLNWLTAEADRSLLNLVVRVLLPCFIIHTILGNERIKHPENLIWPPITGVLTVLIGFAVALLVARHFGQSLSLTSPGQRRTFALTVGIYNYGYIPIPLSALLFPGDQGTLAVLLVNGVTVELMVWTAGVALVAGSVGSQGWKNILNAPLIALVAALTANFIGLDAYTPQWISQGIALLGNAAIPMGMVLIGATIMDELTERAATGPGTRLMIASCVLRLLVLPILFLLLVRVLPASLELQRVIVLMAAMPAAVFPIIVAKHYGGDAPTAVRVVMATSIVSLVTIPLWIAGGFWFLGLT